MPIGAIGELAEVDDTGATLLVWMGATTLELMEAEVYATGATLV